MTIQTPEFTSIQPPFSPKRAIKQTFLNLLKALPESSRMELMPSHNEFDARGSFVSDIRLLGCILGHTLLRHEGDSFFRHIEAIRLSVKSRKADLDITAVQSALIAMIADAETQASSPEEIDFNVAITLKKVSAAFRLFLTLANTVENYHITLPEHSAHERLEGKLKYILNQPHFSKQRCDDRSRQRRSTPLRSE